MKPNPLSGLYHFTVPALRLRCIQFGAMRRSTNGTRLRSRSGDRAPNLQHLRNLKSFRALPDPDFQLHPRGDTALPRSFQSADMKVGL